MNIGKFRSLGDNTYGDLRLIDGRVLIEMPSLVVLNMQPSDIVSFVREGGDLILQLANGERVVLVGFFEEGSDGSESDLYLSSDGALEAAEITPSASGQVTDVSFSPQVITPENKGLVFADGSVLSFDGVLAQGAGGSGFLDGDLGTGFVPVVGGLGAAVAVAVGGGAVAVGGGAATVLNIVVTAGPVVANNGLVATAYDDTGNVLGFASVASGGFARIEIASGYTGAILIGVQDSNADPDYLDELTGQPKDLETDLRVAGNVDGAGEFTFSITPVTELAVRALLSDGGGDGGTAGTDLASVGVDQIDAANQKVATALGLTDIVATIPTPVNGDETAFSDGTAAQQSYGHVLAAISGLEGDAGIADIDMALDELANSMDAGLLDGDDLTALKAAAAVVESRVDTNDGGVSFFETVTSSTLPAPVINALALQGGAAEHSSGTALTLEATLSEAVTVDETGGVPTLTLDINGQAVTATYVGGTGTDKLTFAFTSPGGDGSGLSITAIDLNSGTIIGADATDPSGLPLDITVGVGMSQLTMDNTAPVVTTASFDVNEGVTAVGTIAVTEANSVASTGGYTLGGADSSLFTISDMGELSLNTAQDFEAPGDDGANGVYDLTVEVTDAAGNTGSPQAITVNLKNINEVPILGTAIVDSTAVVDQAFSLDVSNSFTDPDASDTLTYSATGLPEGLSISSAGVITGTATAAAAANDVVVTATDDAGLSVTDTFQLGVVSAPVINALALQGGAAVRSSGTSLTLEATLSEAVTVDTTGGTPSLTLDVNGEVVVANYSGGTGTDKLTFAFTSPGGDGSGLSITAIDLNSGTITGNLSDQALVLSSSATTTDLTMDNTAPVVTTASFDVNEGVTAVGTIAVTEANSVASTGGYTLGGADSSLFTISDMGELSLNTAQDFEAPGDDGANGVYDLTVEVTDAAGNTGSPQAITVNLKNINEVPILGTAIVDSTAVVDQAFSLDVSNSFTDPDASDTLTYSATGLPAGLSISSAGVITGTATAAAAANDVVVTATDDAGLSVTDTFQLGVVSAPVINALALQGGAAVRSSGTSLTLEATLSEAVTVDTTGGTPSLTLDVNGEVVVANYSGGTGTDKLTFAFTSPGGDGSGLSITAIDLNSGTITGNLSDQALVLSSSATTTDLTMDNTAPVVTTTSFSVNESSPFAVEVAVTEANSVASTGGYTLGGADSSLFTISDMGELSLNTAQDFEAPGDDGANGVYDLTVEVTDAAGNTGSPQAITVNLKNINEVPILGTAIVDSTAVVDQAFSLDVSNSFTDPDASDTLTYSATGLPAGLSISSAGVITGTATAAAAANDVVVTATDDAGLSVTDTFQLGVVSAPVASSTVAGVSNLDVQSNIVLTFSEAVSVATGDIRIIDLGSDGAGGNGFDQDSTINTQTIDVTSTTMVTVDGNKVIINPQFDLDFGSQYRIEVDAGAFTGDSSGQGSVALDSNNGITFTTVTPTTAGAQSARMLADDTTTEINSLIWVDTKGQGSSGPTPAQVTFDADGGQYAFYAGLLSASKNQGYDAHMLIQNFAADTADDAGTAAGDDPGLVLGDILYYDNQGDNSISNQHGDTSITFNRVVINQGDTNTLGNAFVVSFATGQPGPNRLETVDIEIPVHSDAAWAHFTDYTVSPLIIG